MSLTDPDEIGKDEDSGLDEEQVVEGGLAVLHSRRERRRGGGGIRQRSTKRGERSDGGSLSVPYSTREWRGIGQREGRWGGHAVLKKGSNDSMGWDGRCGNLAVLRYRQAGGEDSEWR